MTVQKQFDLENYLTTGVENIVKGAIKATLKDPKESAFMVSLLLPARKGPAAADSGRIRANISRPFSSPVSPAPAIYTAAAAMPEATKVA